AEAERLAAEGKVLVHIDGGLHATEVAGPQHTPLLAYDLLNKVNEPATKAMLDNVVLMLWPTINPDGQQMVAEWYMKNVGTPYELSGLPQLYQYATPHEYTINDFPANMRDLRPQSLYASAWKPGWWRLRDAVDYMETASLATIEYASKYKDSLLMNRYRAGRDQIALGGTKP